MPSPSLLRTLAVPLLLLLSQAGPPVRAQEAPQTGLATTRLTAGIHAIRAQVAQTPEEHAIGLMHRSSMPTNEGMLFIFPSPAKQCFWMKNTLLPLSAAFILDDGTLVNIEDMKPRTLDSHCSKKPVRFVLEMQQGWFAKRGLRAGDKLEGKVFSP
jgi:uncharacterized membrane protein (UPF0127 family)